ncbi:hypothetical protein [Streptomyces sp. ODS28]
MLDAYVAAVAALLFALYLRIRWYVLLGDGLAIAGGLFVLYLIIAAL